MGMKALLFLMVVGCGQSECYDYSVVYCGKAAACFGINQAQCEEEVQRQMDAEDHTEAQCAVGKKKLAPMSCDQFRALVSAYLR